MKDLNPIEWAVVPLRKYAVFSGRAPRAEYWWFYLATLLVSMPLRLVDYALGTDGLFDGVVSLALVVPWIAVTVRRLHDTDRSGWWLFALAIPLLLAGALIGYQAATGADWGVWTMSVTAIAGVCAIALFIFAVLPGTDGPNRYGADPYGPDQLEEVFA